jgi:hypothetical protein
MTDIELVPIGTLDRSNRKERLLDDLLQRVTYKNQLGDSSDTFADHILDAYLAVVRRRNRYHRKWDRLGSLYCDFAAITRLRNSNQLEHVEELANHALRCAESGDLKGAIDALKRHIPELKRLIHEEQSKIAKTERNDPLRTRIFQLAKKIRKFHGRKCTFEELRSELQEMAGDDVVERVLSDGVLSRNPANPRRPTKTTMNGTIRNILTKANNKALSDSRK